MSVRLNHEAFGTYETTNERKGTLYSTGTNYVSGSNIRGVRYCETVFRYSYCVYEAFCISSTRPHATSFWQGMW